MELEEEKQVRYRLTIWESLRLPLRFLLIVWLIQIFQDITGHSLASWGIFPQRQFGLWGILYAPLLHSGWDHLISNSLPFVVLGTMLLYFFPRVAVRSFLGIYFLTGIAVWLFAQTGSYHIGLSYVVYGLVSFIFWTGVFRRSIKSIVLSLVVLSVYSGMFSGIFPTMENITKNISWESHLFGAIVGVLLAFYFRSELEEDEKDNFRPRISSEKTTPYFAADIFDKTKAERLQELWEEQERQRQAAQERQAEEARKRNNPDDNPFNGWFSNIT